MTNSTLSALLQDSPGPDGVVQAVTQWAAGRGLNLYPHQEESLLELVTGSNVILATPTGSGKSLVAIAAHAAALARGERTVYTAPLKALVSEKFFALVEAFGAQQVGMMTGDTVVNGDAPIICCTAEVLANQALRQGAELDFGQVVMDEFHFYADPQRGWAWQVPLLELPDVQFLLMSATLGDVSFFTEDLTERTGREVAVIDSAERPVPLTFSYEYTPLTELLDQLVGTGRAPVYVVHFTQREAVERAQALLSTVLTTREQRDRIAAELSEVHFASGFGKILAKLLRHGVGVHHAGMLPRYRRVVERLTQQGLLPVVCGTDTLGVGINVPIRTVLFTTLVKYDGERSRHLTAREFHQVAGRAGRAGFDAEGEVIVMAPEHVIANRKALEKAGDDERKRRKVVRKQAPAGVLNWTDKTFERLRDASPEALTPQLRVDHAMVLNVLARPGDPVAAMSQLLTQNHQSLIEQRALVRRAITIYRSLRQAGVVERYILPDDGSGRTRRSVRLTVDLPEDFALHQPLSPFGYAARDLLDIEDPAYALDLLSIIESTLEGPGQILAAQTNVAKRAAIAEMKAEGYEYDERMAALEEVTYPQPLAELIAAAFTEYRKTNPWVLDAEPQPKSIVRDMIETAATFSEYISRYGLERTEGVLLRYLSDAYRALRRSVPPEALTEELEDYIEWLGQVVRGTDSSLLDEWAELVSGGTLDGTAKDPAAGGELRAPGSSQFVNVRVLRAWVRQQLMHRLELLDREDYRALAALGDTDASGNLWDQDRWAAAIDPYFEDYGYISTDAAARGPALFDLVVPATGGAPTGQAGEVWHINQTLSDPDGNHDWRLTARLTITPATAPDEPDGKIDIFSLQPLG